MKTNDAGARDQDQIARAFKAYYDCERLERDKSTSNTSISIDIADRLRGALKRADKMRSPVCVGDRVGDNRDERS